MAMQSDLPNPQKGVRRWEANMDALRTLLQIEREGRRATPEERRVLFNDIEDIGDDTIRDALLEYRNAAASELANRAAAKEKPAKRSSPKPKPTRPKAKVSKQPTPKTRQGKTKAGLPDPRTVFEARSAASQVADISRQHSLVSTQSSPQYPAWIRDGGSADVKGVDTKAVTDTTLKRSAAQAVGARRRSTKKRK